MPTIPTIMIVVILIILGSLFCICIFFMILDNYESIDHDVSVVRNKQHVIIKMSELEDGEYYHRINDR